VDAGGAAAEPAPWLISTGSPSDHVRIGRAAWWRIDRIAP